MYKPRREFIETNSGSQLLLEKILESLAILGKLLDALVKLVPCHGVLQKLPAEFGLVVDVGDFGDRVGFCSYDV